jgi:hypothetical protein
MPNDRAGMTAAGRIAGCHAEWSPHMSTDRLAFRGNPLRQFFSAGPWWATIYLASYVPVGTVCFVVCLAVLLVSSLLNVTWLGLPLLIGAAAVLRGCATVERLRTRVTGMTVASRYRPVTGAGLFAHLSTRWHDPGTWRDVAYLVGMFPVLFVLDIASLVIWAVCLAGITMPAWYWTSRDGVPVGGLFRIDSLPAALVTMAVSIVPVVLASYFVVGAARAHRALARMVLGPYVDPLAEAKRVLAGPGPLPTI